jgi:hypothetical protein
VTAPGVSLSSRARNPGDIGAGRCAIRNNASSWERLNCLPRKGVERVEPSSLDQDTTDSSTSPSTAVLFMEMV